MAVTRSHYVHGAVDSNYQRLALGNLPGVISHLKGALALSKHFCAAAPQIYIPLHECESTYSMFITYTVHYTFVPTRSWIRRACSPRR